MHLENLFDTGVHTPLGYRATSSSTKPVHVANGLFRATLGMAYDPRLLNRVVNRWARRRTEERHTSDAILADAPAPFGVFADTPRRHLLDGLRDLLRDVLNADGAVYDKNENCSYTLTSQHLVTPDHNDRGTGLFLYTLLATDLGGGPSPALEVLARLLADDSDEIAVMTLPLLDDTEGHPAHRSYDEVPASLAIVRDRRSGLRFASPVTGHLRDGFDALGRFLASDGGKLQNLRRIVTFATLALYLHLVGSAARDEQDDTPEGARRPPLLLDLVQEGWTPVGAASYATYLLAAKSVDHLTERGIATALTLVHSRWTQQRVDDFVADLTLSGRARDQERKRRNVLDACRSYAAGGATILDALVLALADLAHEELTATPFDFARAIGVRSGLLAPRGNRAVKKRYAPSAEVIEVLLASVLGAGEEVDLATLAARWWDRYRILVGARSSDAAELAAFSITDASAEDLGRNADALRDLLLALGYARSYADGVTVIRLSEGGTR